MVTRGQFLRIILWKPWWAVAVIFWALVGIYDQIISQFVPKQIADDAPTALQALAWTFRLVPDLPGLFWLVGSLALLAVMFESGFRAIRKREDTIESFGRAAVEIQIPAPVGLLARVLIRNTGAAASFRVSVNVVGRTEGGTDTGLGTWYIAPWLETTKPDQDIPTGGCGVLVLARQGSLVLSTIEGAKRFRDVYGDAIVAGIGAGMQQWLMTEKRSGALMEILEFSPEGPRPLFSFMCPSYVVLEIHAHSSLPMPLAFTETIRVSSNAAGNFSVSREVVTP